MAYRLLVEIEEAVLQRARVLARRFGCDIEDVLSEWVGDYADHMPVDLLPNEEILMLCEYEVNPSHAYELRYLLDSYRERALSDQENTRLDDLLATYRRALVRKSQAIQVAQTRGLTVKLP